MADDVLTQTQRKTLKQAAEHPLGLSEWLGTNTSGKAKWSKMRQELADRGLMKPYIYPGPIWAGRGYEITDLGRAALKAVKGS